MLRKSAVVAVVITAALAMPVRAEDLERTVPLRSFDRFALDNGTVDGFWAEAGAVYEQTEQNDPTSGGKIKADAETPFARLAYGAKDKWEADLLIPYHFANADLHSSGTSTNLLSDNGIGDIELSTKCVPLRGQLADLGVGVLLSLPSGDDNKGFGSGEFGGMPFVTGAMHLTVVDLQAHVGAEFFTGSNSGGGAANRIQYGFDIVAPIGKYVAFRNEFAGTDYYDLPNSTKAVSYEPGFDIRIPVGNLDVLLRPTGMVGLTEAAADWGVGGSIVISSPTMRAAVGPGGVVIE